VSAYYDKNDNTNKIAAVFRKGEEKDLGVACVIFY
jgi:hypothetical protein